MADDGSAEGSRGPLPQFQFRVDIGDGHASGFSEVSGLDSESIPIEYRHSDSPPFSRMKMPALGSVGNVTLKRGLLVRESGLWDWLARIRGNVIERRTIVISLLDEAGNPAMRWTLANAWPIKMTGPELNAESNEVAIESIEIAHDGVTVSGAP
jgi:phage tail-like protein